MSDARVSEASVVRFLHHFEEVALHEDFDLLEDMIDERAYGRFNDGDHVGRAAVRAAFEKTWRGDPTVVKAGFYLSDIVVLTTDVSSATATYTYTWEGAKGDRPFRIQGRGTRELAFDATAFRIVHEHLSGFPRGGARVRWRRGVARPSASPVPGESLGARTLIRSVRRHPTDARSRSA